jgi:hypothetical protein
LGGDLGFGGFYRGISRWEGVGVGMHGGKV